ncbi:PEP-CTERM sorting domain-containing protein [Opitutaceae bacterium TAV4]|nr:PEP-CTERM sorting domain-containing protein [Opitutaceae bacterium TAV4]RRJ99885.1 PEP-CTERM sorting domain-containing protein [Opitutaceae bacterium TAV3]
MKTQITLHKTLVLSIAGVLLAAISHFAPTTARAASDTIVAWGPSKDYVGGHTNGVGLSNGVVAFSDTVARNPGNPYPGGQPSGTYYGGAASTNASGITVWRILNGGEGNDAINFAGPLVSGETLTALFLWGKNDFLGGYNADAKNARLTAFNATINHAGSGTLLNTSVARWVVQVSPGTYYVSDAFTTTTIVTTYSLSNPESVNWFKLEPGTSLTAIGAKWAEPDFSNVTAVGLWWQLKALGTVAAAEGRITAFSATATSTIPEPSSYALLATGLIVSATLLIRRRK